MKLRPEDVYMNWMMSVKTLWIISEIGSYNALHMHENKEFMIWFCFRVTKLY